MLKKGDKSGALKYTKRMDTVFKDYILDLMGEEDKNDWNTKNADKIKIRRKTRIAQLQLQIAKALYMINKLNSQEKPNIPKVLKTKEGSLESAVLEAESPSKVNLNAISKRNH